MAVLSFMQTITQAKSAEFSLKARLHGLLAGSQPARPLTKLHASSVTKADFCARRHALLTLTNTPQPPEYITTSLAVTFGIGHAVQDLIVGWASDLKIAVSDWRCVRCSHLHTFCKKPVVCASCGYNHFRPIEIRAHDPVSGISCGIDLLIDAGRPKLTPVEIKTMAPDEFKSLVAPLSEHRVRTSLYLRTIAASPEISPWVSTDEALVLYVSKGGFGVKDVGLKALGVTEQFSPFKEFTVARNDALIEPLWLSAKTLTDWRFNEGPPPARICKGQSDPLAAACPVRAYCFGNMLGD